jgi:IclR family pca regulon transcriptional regulator
MPRILTLGYSYISSMPLGSAVQPLLQLLSHRVHESCSLETLDGADIICVARAHVTRPVSIDLGVGRRAPAFCTSTGRVLLAHLPGDELELHLDKIRFQRLTDRTVTSLPKLRQALQLVRQNGYCIVDQELEIGLRSIAVPVRNSFGRVVAALNVLTTPQRVPLQQMQTELLPNLRATANELDKLLLIR